ncbi:MAG: hypothetical protein IJP98_01505 [Clostridia bacterium]|nr:hypothetical protein [Clostridia bacterium]
MKQYTTLLRIVQDNSAEPFEITIRQADFVRILSMDAEITARPDPLIRAF